MQSYGVRRTHAESENTFNVTVQLKACEAAAAALLSRWEWSCLHTSHCFWTDGQTHAEHTKFGSFFGENTDTSSFKWFFCLETPVLAPASQLSIPPFVSVGLTVLLKWPGSNSLVYSAQHGSVHFPLKYYIIHRDVSRSGLLWYPGFYVWFIPEYLGSF